MSVALISIGSITNTFSAEPAQILYKTAADRLSGRQSWSPLISASGHSVSCIQVTRDRDGMVATFEVPSDFYRWILANPDTRVIEACGLGCLSVNGTDALVPTITLRNSSGSAATFVTQQSLVNFFKTV